MSRSQSTNSETSCGEWRRRTLPRTVRSQGAQPPRHTARHGQEQDGLWRTAGCIDRSCQQLRRDRNSPSDGRQAETQPQGREESRSEPKGTRLSVDRSRDRHRRSAGDRSTGCSRSSVLKEFQNHEGALLTDGDPLQRYILLALMTSSRAGIFCLQASSAATRTRSTTISVSR